MVESGDPGVWWLIVAYEEEEVGLQAVREAVRLVRACMSGEPFDVQYAVEDLHDLLESVRLGPSTAAIVEEAQRRGIPVRRLNNYSLVQLGLGKNLRRVQAAMSDYTSAIGVEIAQDKDDTRRVLGAIGLPVPEGVTASSAEAAVDAAGEIGWPVLIKPLDASHGRGISGALRDDDAVRRAYAVASAYGRRVIVEQFVTGRDYRVLVVDGRVAAVAERVPAHVVGDGHADHPAAHPATPTATRGAARATRAPSRASRTTRPRPPSWPPAALPATASPPRGSRSSCARRPTFPPAAPPSTARTRSTPTT